MVTTSNPIEHKTAWFLSDGRLVLCMDNRGSEQLKPLSAKGRPPKGAIAFESERQAQNHLNFMRDRGDWPSFAYVHVAKPVKLRLHTPRPADKQIVIAWVESRVVYARPGYPHLTETKPHPCAVLWVRRGREKDVTAAERYRDSDRPEGKIFTYPMTESDPLGRARGEIINSSEYLDVDGNPRR